MSLAAGVGVYVAVVPRVSGVALQVAGSASTAGSIVGAHAHDFRTSVIWDFWLIGGYSIALMLACWLGRRVFLGRVSRKAASAGIWLTLGAAVANIVQDVLLLNELPHPSNHGPWIFRLVQALSFTKFSALLVAAPVGVCAWSTVILRLARSATAARQPLGDHDVIPPRPRERPSGWETQAEDLTDAQDGFPGTQPAIAAEAHWYEEGHLPPGRKRDGVGICVSGGGVRSAAVTLGALQALREGGELARADYLVSVSGGGYMAGAFQLALTPAGQPTNDGVSATPKNVYYPGSLEEDYTRRHSSYLSDGLGQWLVALGTLFRGMLSSLALISLTVATVGLAVGGFYRVTKISAIYKLKPRFLPHAAAAVPRFPRPMVGVTLAIAALASLTVAAYLAELFWLSSSGHEGRVVTPVATALRATTGLLVAVGVVIPTVVWVSAWTTWHLGHTTPGTVASAGTVTVVLSYLGTLAATLWRNRKTITNSASVLSKGAAGQALPYSMVQMLLMWVCLLVLLLLLSIAAGWVAASGAERSWWALAPVVALIIATLTIDQTWLSLHPFYRGRLASAFAVRRTRRHGRFLAEPYRREKETTLSTFAKPVHGFPKVIFAATANLTGQDRTPPGRRAVSYTLASDWVGGPEVGWVATAKLEQHVSKHVRRDLTVEAAVAISGAAFASAMGAQTRFYELFLALTDARLGAWLPNPYYLWVRTALDENWSIPRLPNLRHLGYFAREIFGLHPSTSPLLFCTDGGHYENLGLVELLRHRCRLIYCVDASGDNPPLATTLAQAITLAREELGVEITLEDPLALVPGAAIPLEPESPLAALNPRLSRSVTCVGKIVYPEPAATEGKLIVAKAALTRDMPYNLLSYALQDLAFPRDSTSDQWFNWGQFDAYQQLGTFLGEKAIAARRR